MSVAEATEAAIAAASHLTEMDQGTVETLRFLAVKIDTESELRALALAWAEEHEQKPPAVDNVSIPTYLKFAESLGLTPAGRKVLTEKKQGAQGGGKLAHLRSVHAGT